MGGSLINEPRAWKTELEGSVKVQKLWTSASGSIKPSGLNIGGRVTEVELVDTAWRALPTVALEKRNAIAIQNESGSDIKINYINTVGVTIGMTIKANGGERYYDISDSIVIYGRSTSGTVNVNVEEIA